MTVLLSRLSSDTETKLERLQKDTASERQHLQELITKLQHNLDSSSAEAKVCMHHGGASGTEAIIIRTGLEPESKCGCERRGEWGTEWSRNVRAGLCLYLSKPFLPLPDYFSYENPNCQCW